MTLARVTLSCMAATLIGHAAWAAQGVVIVEKTTVNGAPGSKQPSYAKLDARLAIGSTDGRWEVALVGRNLTDELYGVWYEPLVGAGPNTGTGRAVGATDHPRACDSRAQS